MYMKKQLSQKYQLYTQIIKQQEYIKVRQTLCLEIGQTADAKLNAS